MDLSSKILKQSVKIFCISKNLGAPEELKGHSFFKNNIIKVILYSNETLWQILKAISKDLPEI